MFYVDNFSNNHDIVIFTPKKTITPEDRVHHNTNLFNFFG